jgi:hypothetical protein
VPGIYIGAKPVIAHQIATGYNRPKKEQTQGND